MKSDFCINVQVNVGITPEVVTLVTAILAHRPSQAREVKGFVEQPQPAVEQPQARHPETAVSEKQQPQPETAVEPAHAPSTATTTAEEKPKELTVADVREAMHKTRQRIEGEDYKEHTDGEGYKKYHRVLNGVFKQIAALLGADLPSQLPAEQRQAFIDECEQLQIQQDGTIGKELPF